MWLFEFLLTVSSISRLMHAWPNNNIMPGCFLFTSATILTVVSELASQVDQAFLTTLFCFLFSSGHVSLTYPSGGVLLASAGHWIELQKVHTDEKTFFNAVYSSYGSSSERSRSMWTEYSSLSAARKKQWLSKQAEKTVQSRSAAKYSFGSKWSRSSSSTTCDPDY